MAGFPHSWNRNANSPSRGHVELKWDDVLGGPSPLLPSYKPSQKVKKSLHFQPRSLCQDAQNRNWSATSGMISNPTHLSRLPHNKSDFNFGYSTFLLRFMQIQPFPPGRSHLISRQDSKPKPDSTVQVVAELGTPRLKASLRTQSEAQCAYQCQHTQLQEGKEDWSQHAWPAQSYRIGSSGPSSVSAIRKHFSLASGCLSPSSSHPKLCMFF